MDSSTEKVFVEKAQPGLEPVAFSDKEVGSPPQHYQRQYAVYEGLEVSPQDFPEVTEVKPLPEVKPPHIDTARRIRRRWFAVGVVLILLVSVGGVLGGILGRNLHNQATNNATEPSSQTGSATATSTSTSASPTASVTLASMRQGSKLAVAGWREDDNFHARFFYQDPEAGLHYLTYYSTNENWSMPPSKVSTSNPLAGTALGAAMNMGPIVQVQNYWLNDTTFELSGQNFNDVTLPAGGAFDPVDDPPVSADSQSRIACYWPYIVVQQTDGRLHLVSYVFPVYSNAEMDVVASAGSGMAIVPQTVGYGQPLTAGLLYRSEQGFLSGVWLQYNKSASEWDMGSNSLSVAQDSPLAAFAMSNSDQAESLNKIYAVYIDPENVMQYVAWSNNNWGNPTTHDALTGADNGTDITCLTEGIWDNRNQLSTKTDMSRCYFQSGGRIKEVMYNGTSWTVVGFLPLT